MTKPIEPPVSEQIAGLLEEASDRQTIDEDESEEALSHTRVMKAMHLLALQQQKILERLDRG